jgi:hypothetical protein
MPPRYLLKYYFYLAGYVLIAVVIYCGFFAEP